MNGLILGLRKGNAMSEQDDKRREVEVRLGLIPTTNETSLTVTITMNVWRRVFDHIIELEELALFQHEMIQTAKPIARGSRTGQFMVAAHCKYFLENYTKYRQMIKKVLPPESEESDD